MNHIFISYSRTNKDFAIELVNALKKSGHAVWIDQSDIIAGEDWSEKINEAIRGAKAFVIIVSRASLASTHVRGEINVAANLKKAIIPVRIENTDPDILIDGRQTVGFSSKPFDRAFEELLTALPALGSTPKSLRDKLKSPKSQFPKIIAVGAVYADVLLIVENQQMQDMFMLSPDNEEIINQHEAQIGGSTYLIAKKLDAVPTLKGNVTLITKIGDMSLFSADPYAFFVGKGLIDSDLMASKDGANLWWHPRQMTAVTYILKWNGQETMITHPGVIETLSWDDVDGQTASKPNTSLAQNVLYVGGYFKTALYQQLPTKLREFDQSNTLVVTNPGRFHWVNPDLVIEDDKAGQIQVSRQNSLRDNLDYIDIYLASGTEFRTLFSDYFIGRGKFDVKLALAYLGEQGIPLPKVMCIRDHKQKRVCIYPYDMTISAELTRNIYSSSTFDALFLSKLFEIRTSETDEFQPAEIIQMCVEHAVGKM